MKTLMNLTLLGMTLLAPFAALAETPADALARDFVAYCEKARKNPDEPAFVTIEAMTRYTNIGPCDEMAAEVRKRKEMNLTAPNLTDVTALNFFPELTRISLSTRSRLQMIDLKERDALRTLVVYGPMTTVPFLGENVEAIDIERAGLTSLAGLEYYKNLKHLMLTDSPLTDFNDYNNLADLTQVETLRIVGAGISSLDLIPLVALSKTLKTLSLAANPLYDVTMITVATNLENLNLSGTKIEDIAPIGKIRRLKKLTLRNSQFVRSWKPIRKLRNLTHLDVSFSGINHFDLLEMLDEQPLTWLTTDFNSLSKIPDHPALAKVQVLRAANNKIRTLGKLPDTLRELEVDHNHIKDISKLSGAGLKRVSVQGSMIRDMTPLAKLPKLEWLDLSDNGIKDLSTLAGAEGLKSLLLDNNFIEDLSPLKDLEKINSFQFQHNPLGTTIDRTEENCPRDSRSPAIKRWCSRF